MTRVKICGITNREDAEAAAAYGADALGFIAVPHSPRFVSPERFEEIAAQPPLFVKRVVVVMHPEDANNYPADYIQYYHETTDKGQSRRNTHWRIKCFRMKDASTLDEIQAFSDPVSALLLDTYHKDKLGGAGETFNWDLAVEAKRLSGKAIILAGGLTPENVADALEAVRPECVDVASGVESSPGVKDHAKVKAFIKAVRAWDARQS
ncbi:N-(5'-phosphoribosyl)anthranilate isomerase [Capsulimonas corticalis]|uniref:N-(5'-phosphoribosyl)anthranilate isomerase n=1 Tax=Capsulimonas corticalis TaxID=2219043 RepID=A0A402D2C2_9BACT|nr:phosphoribosylanthranilate isomerase [Capsulimonas corticalis]BDI29996.1 N-(5'-phosphoribosyl)anthranilate isomerase [Capsulimonas corticalis]